MKAIHDAICSFLYELNVSPNLVNELVSKCETGKILYYKESDNNGITGIVGITRDGFGEIFWVRPDKRKTNLAMRLFNVIHKIAKSEGIKTLKVYASMQRARMYEKRGYKTTMVIMEKTL